jgi:23S rRNA pseudouridine2605 synthase
LYLDSQGALCIFAKILAMSSTQGKSGKGKSSGRGGASRNRSGAEGSASSKSKDLTKKKGKPTPPRVRELGWDVKPSPAKKPNKKEGIRLNKYIANSGICSRREADTYIATGLVTVNGKIVNEMGHMSS